MKLLTYWNRNSGVHYVIFLNDSEFDELELQISRSIEGEYLPRAEKFFHDQGIYNFASQLGDVIWINIKDYDRVKDMHSRGVF